MDSWAGETYHMLNSSVSRQGHAWRKDGCFQESKERFFCLLATGTLSMNQTLSWPLTMEARSLYSLILWED